MEDLELETAAAGADAAVAAGPSQQATGAVDIDVQGPGRHARHTML